MTTLQPTSTHAVDAPAAGPTSRSSCRDDDVAALAEVHGSLIDTVALRYQDHGVALSPLYDVARTALARAAADYDPEKGVDFVTHALPYIRAAVKRSFREAGGHIGRPLPRTPAPVLHHANVSDGD